ncbi:MAG: tetratricopeptide repeat protein [Pseudomonadota bacterium]
MAHDCTNFETQVLARSQQVPVLVDFWAAWCQPCRSLGPVLERLAESAEGRWELCKVDTEALPDVAKHYAVRSIPAVKLFHRGQVVDEFVGALSEAQVQQWLTRALPSPYRDALDRARQLLLEEGYDEVRALLQPILDAEPRLDEARVLLAEATLPSDPRVLSTLLEPVDEGSRFFARAHALKTLAELLTLAQDPASLPEASVRERFVGGALAVQAGQLDQALEAFIDVIVRRRDYHDGGAVEACKAIFELLGPEHPVTARHRQAFASALFS